MTRFIAVAAAVIAAYSLGLAPSAVRPARATGDAAHGQAGKVLSVSCSSPGNCVAAGSFTGRSRHQQAFVVNEARGKWRLATPVPGLRDLNAGGRAGIHQVSCPSAGNCAAGGWYTDGDGHIQGFVASEVSGTWQPAIEVPGLAVLNVKGNAVVESLSCASAGNCSAAGSYVTSPTSLHPFVADEVRGKWRPAHEVPGSLITTSVTARILSLSCGAPGDCAAGGAYTVAGKGTHAFVADEVDGTWGPAKQVPGTAALNVLKFAEATSIACPSAGNCAAGGFYASRTGLSQAFVANETNGIWHAARAVRPPASQQPFKDSEIAAISCSSAGNCAAGGDAARQGPLGTLVVTETRGKWEAGKLIPVPGALNIAPEILAMSCASRANCSAGGQDEEHQGLGTFVVAESHGVWSRASQIPGLATLNTGGLSQFSSVSCTAPGDCSAGGFYSTDPTAPLGHQQAFVATQTAGKWGTAIKVPGL